MLLKIDPVKLEEQRRTSEASYSVATCNIDPLPSDPLTPPETSIAGCSMSMPLALEQARARLLNLRQRLIADGMPPLSSSDLDAELLRTRGRS